MAKYHNNIQRKCCPNHRGPQSIRTPFKEPGKVSQGTCKRDAMCYQCYICQGNDKTQYSSQILLTDMVAFHVQHHARQTVTKSERGNGRC